MVNKKDLISIGLPVYNCQDYLVSCIKSIINQTYQNWELIIVNDGSLDDSPYMRGKYIQISNKGLYHLGDDICNFQVPLFDCEQELRVRTKIHSRSNSKGFCCLSVTIACKPRNIKNLSPSTYSLDNIQMLPNNLTYIS